MHRQHRVIDRANLISGIKISQPNDETYLFEFTNGSLKVTIRQGDLTKEKCDALVNPTNESMRPTGGLDEIMHNYMGEFFTKQVLATSGTPDKNVCAVGQSRIFIAKEQQTNDCATYIINTVGPKYQDDNKNESQFLLQSCYHTSFTLAEIYGIKSIAFPAISCGAYKYPPQDAAKVAIDSIRRFASNVNDVRFVLWEPAVYQKFVTEWMLYCDAINKEANELHRATREENRRRIDRHVLSPTSSAASCILCKEKQSKHNWDVLCNSCKKLSRSELFIQFLECLRSAAEQSIDSLREECQLLKPLLTNFDIKFNPNKKFDINIHKRDHTAEYYLQSHCTKTYRRLMPMAIVGDGNCFYNTFVKLNGNEATDEASSFTPIELRARNIVELVLNEKIYQKNYEKLANCLDDFTEYVTTEMVHDRNYASFWDFLSIPTVLTTNVTVVYPYVNGEEDEYYRTFNGVQLRPLSSDALSNTKKSSSNEMITKPMHDVIVLFSHCDKPSTLSSQKKAWLPNHFVPLLSLR